MNDRDVQHTFQDWIMRGENHRFFLRKDYETVVGWRGAARFQSICRAGEQITRFLDRPLNNSC
jgi:hypothetical protein